MELAANANLTHVALADHDTLDGLSRARSAAEELGLGFIPAVELSVDHNSTKIHMLVYFLEPEDGPLQSRMADLLAGRTIRNMQIIRNLNEIGYDISLSDVERHAKGPSVGRPHIADALVERGYFASRNEAFADLLRDGGRVYVERDRLTAKDAMSLARQSRAVPVIAHPITMGLNRFEYADTFRELKELGLGGIEAYYPSHSPELREHLAGVARDLSIAATGGSDYHGMEKREYRVGIGTGDLHVPELAVQELHDQLNR